MSDNVLERFLNDTKDHEMEIIRDAEESRHLKFTRNGSQVYRFDLITGPGYLCITGDMGTYVFSRVRDMFEFFRQDKLKTKPNYWGQKLESICNTGGFRRYSDDKFRERVKDFFDEYVECEGLEEKEADELWMEITDDVLEYAIDEMMAYNAVNEFQPNVFQDFFDGGGTDEYTFHYLWCLFAIVWGISKYDEFKGGE